MEPLLFLVYTNDLLETVIIATKLFAEDIKLYREVNKLEDSKSIQEDINTLKNWSDTWLIKYDASKCKCIHLNKINPNHQYVMGDISTNQSYI